MHIAPISATGDVKLIARYNAPAIHLPAVRTVMHILIVLSQNNM